jgi:hypothetical protein
MVNHGKINIKERKTSGRVYRPLTEKISCRAVGYLFFNIIEIRTQNRI